jgi:hypothetical protein
MRGQPGPAVGWPGCKFDPRIHLFCEKAMDFRVSPLWRRPGNDSWFALRNIRPPGRL